MRCRPGVHKQLQSALLLAPTLCRSAEHQYAALHDVVFSLNASQQLGVLYTNSTVIDSASSCNQRCSDARALGVFRTNCTMWRYCTSASGCSSSLSDTASALRTRECQLQSFYLLDEGFSEEPYLQLGKKGINVHHTLYGMPITPSPITLRPCLLLTRSAKECCHMSIAVRCWQLIMQLCLHKHAAVCNSLGDCATWRTGAPIRFSDTDTPVLQGYAQYPCLHYPGIHDFTTGCPFNASKFPGLELLTQYNDSTSQTWCWVRGALKVLPIG